MLLASSFLSLITAGAALSEPRLFVRNATSPNGSQCACGRLSMSYSNLTLTPDNARYEAENTNAWDKRSNLAPSCIFLPTTDTQVADAVAIFHSCDAEFAIRGGGHMNVSRAAEYVL